MITITNKLFVFIACAIALLTGTTAHALTPGASYTISIEKVNSNGTVTSGATSLALSTTVAADTSGKVAFSFGSSVPTSPSCNFLVISIKDSLGANVRDAIAPCPSANSTVPLGVSGVTDKQTDALLAAFLASGTDDPIVAIFGFAIVRSGNMSALDVAAMADVCYRGLYNPGGFIDYLKMVRGVGDAQLATYRKNIVAQLGSASSGYSKLMKDSVDATDGTTAAGERGKAAGQVLKTLLTAAEGVFQQDYVMEAFDAMGSIALPLMTSKISAGTLSATGAGMVEAGIGGGLSKLRADRALEKYSAAMTLMNASGSDLAQFNSAALALRTAMDNAYAQFEGVYSEDASRPNGDISANNTVFGTAMQTAFVAYMNAMAVVDARIVTMRAGIAAVSGSAPDPQFFKFPTNNGAQINWPVNMVVLMQWATGIAQSGGSLSYTQDTNAEVPIPLSLQQFMGTCSNAAFSYDQSACQTNGGTWTVGRKNFASSSFLPANFPYGHLMNIQQDLMIREASRMSNRDPQAAEQDFNNGKAVLASRISGNADGASALSLAQKQAVVTLMQSPQF